jgi:hypothetical protein
VKKALLVSAFFISSSPRSQPATSARVAHAALQLAAKAGPEQRKELRKALLAALLALEEDADGR